MELPNQLPVEMLILKWCQDFLKVQNIFALKLQ